MAEPEWDHAVQKVYQTLTGFGLLDEGTAQPSCHTMQQSLKELRCTITLWFMQETPQYIQGGLYLPAVDNSAREVRHKEKMKNHRDPVLTLKSRPTQHWCQHPWHQRVGDSHVKWALMNCQMTQELGNGLVLGYAEGSVTKAAKINTQQATASRTAQAVSLSSVWAGFREALYRVMESHLFTGYSTVITWVQVILNLEAQSTKTKEMGSSSGTAWPVCP